MAEGVPIELTSTAKAPSPPKAPPLSDKWLGLIVPIVVLTAWEIAGQYGALPRYLVAPSVIMSTWWELATSGELFLHIGSSLFRQSTGFAIGATCGVTAGLLAGVFRPVERFYEPLISLIYPVPKIAILPLIFVWFGLGSLSKIVVMTISIFFPTYISAFYGAKAVNKIYLWTALNAGASRVEIFFRVVVPSALPDIFNGLRIGLALSFVLMVTTELVISSSGLGYMIGRAEESLRFDRMYVAIVTIGAIGFCADRLLLMIRARLLVGQLLSKDRGHD
jgi:ABC-type nitrate/sulfonate/bicarbonate transport system permease component